MSSILKVQKRVGVRKSTGKATSGYQGRLCVPAPRSPDSRAAGQQGYIARSPQTWAYQRSTYSDMGFTFEPFSDFHQRKSLRNGTLTISGNRSTSMISAKRSSFMSCVR